MFGPDARIIEPRRNGIDRSDLSVLVLTEIRLHPMEYAEAACRNGSRRIESVDPSSSRFTADKPYLIVPDEMIK